MDERRDPEPDDGTVPPAFTAGVGRLSPVQQAYSDYTSHSIRCDDCRDVDRSCGVAEQLWRTYRSVSGHACDQMTDGAR